MKLVVLLPMAIVTMAWEASSCAEPVMVRSGFDEGQGWIFARHDSCWLATAKHVVENGRGQGEVLGPDRRRAVLVSVHDHATEDLSVATLQGDLAEACPSSGAGDADARSAISAGLARNTPIILYRRTQAGLEPLAASVLGLEEDAPLFVIAPDTDRDAFVASDSGMTILLQGTGVGESLLPIGILLALDEATGSFGTALFFSEARTLVDEIYASGLSSVTPLQVGYRVLGFEGRSDDTACGPINLTRLDTSCGWRARRVESGPPLEVRLSMIVPAMNVRTFEGVLGKGTDVRGVAFATKSDADADWSADRYCSIAKGATGFRCEVAPRSVAAVRVRFAGEAVELLSLSIE